MWNYTDKVKEHFRNPRNVGVIEDADGVGQVGSLACGDALKLTFKLGDGERIAHPNVWNFTSAMRPLSSSLKVSLSASPHANEPTSPTPSGSSISPTFRGLLKCSLTLSV